MRKTTVYRIYSATSGSEMDLLYVGITCDLARRLAEHSRKPWFSAAVYVVAYSYRDRFTAERVEATAIANEHPLHNVDPGSRAARAQPAVDGLDLWLTEVDYDEWEVAR